MLMMMELYFDTNKEAPVLKLYHKIWADAEVEALGIACREYMTKGKNKWFPKAGEILDIIDSWKRPQGSIEALAQQQWRLVMQAVRDRGYGRGAPVFKDPITNTVVRTQFIWEALCDTPVPELKWAEKRFNEAYNLATELEPEQVLIENTPEKVKELISGIGG